MANVRAKFYKDIDLSNISKELLLGDYGLVKGLAEFNVEFGKHPLAQDLDVLGLDYGEVAVRLARNSGKNGWAETPAAQKLEVLKFSGGFGDVAVLLAFNSKDNGWGNTEAAKSDEVLGLQNGRVRKLLEGKNVSTGLNKQTTM